MCGQEHINHSGLGILWVGILFLRILERNSFSRHQCLFIFVLVISLPSVPMLYCFRVYEPLSGFVCLF